MLRPGGYTTVIEADGRISREADTFTCCHCNMIVRVRAGLVMQAPFCGKCMRYQCKACAAKRECVPTEVMLQNMERRPRRQ